ncbi:hypothetical protein AVEN_165188-1 [Araneus ventricosus]|uniref:Uncharacterized protein n=1 Tax=Araneus ventricosus TaxID=182803 RepID=A0A4Y2B6C9_ARAVE|nr:hypothetical protein AVEN_165188-1 [Araneus ventricosus]
MHFSCLFTTSYHLTKPSADLEPLWWKRVLNNNISRAKIRKLIHFIAENEALLFPKDSDNNSPQTQLTLGPHLLSSPIHKAPPSQSQQHKEKTIHLFLRQYGHFFEPTTGICSSDVNLIVKGVKTDSPNLVRGLGTLRR